MSNEARYEIREVGEDCSDLVEVRRLWFPVTDQGFDQRLREWWDRERGQRHALVAYLDGLPVAMVNGQVFTRMPAPGRPPARWLYAANVFVAEPHRRRGLGRALVRELIAFAEHHGMKRVVLAPSPMSIPLYRSMGFRAADDLMRLDRITD